jgi:hypothetical protein
MNWSKPDLKFYTLVRFITRQKNTLQTLSGRFYGAIAVIGRIYFIGRSQRKDLKIFKQGQY